LIKLAVVAIIAAFLSFAIASYLRVADIDLEEEIGGSTFEDELGN